MSGYFEVSCGAPPKMETKKRRKTKKGEYATIRVTVTSVDDYKDTVTLTFTGSPAQDVDDISPAEADVFVDEDESEYVDVTCTPMAGKTITFQAYGSDGENSDSDTTSVSA